MLTRVRGAWAECVCSDSGSGIDLLVHSPIIMQLSKMQQTRPLTGRVTPRLPSACKRTALVCKAQKDSSLSLGQRVAAFGAAAMMSLSTLSGAAVASEFDLLAEGTPSGSYYIDDASVLSVSTKGDLNKKLKELEDATGYRVEVVTVRKLEYETDSFAFTDRLFSKWYPAKEDGDKKGVVLVVTAGKEGAVVGGDAFLSSLGDDLLDSIVGDQIPIYTEQEKYNLTVESTVDRISAKLKGETVPEGPARPDNTRKRTYRTKEETDKSKTVTTTVVASLLLIAVVVPMLQYYGYVAKD